MTPMTKICLTLIVAISIVLAFMAPSYEKGRRARELAAQQVDTVAVIQRILDGGDLSQRWPGAARTMKRMADVFEIDPLLLPVISRAENPAAVYRNPCGLTANGKIIKYESYTFGVYRAAELLAKLKPIYASDNGPNISSLASVWCPESKMQWQANVERIYQQAIAAPASRH